MSSKPTVPQIRVISPDNARTMLASQRLKQALAGNGLIYPVLNVFCHLESGRCGIHSGQVGIEVDGSIIWAGAEFTCTLAQSFCDCLRKYAAQTH